MKLAILSNQNVRRLFIGVLLTILLFLLPACGKSNTQVQTATPTFTSSPITTAIPTGSPTNVTWLADGIITAGEYSNSVTYDKVNFEINWETDSQYIYIGIKAKTTGWVSLGFNATSQLRNIDYVFGWVNNGKANIADEFSADYHGQHQADELLGGTEDIIEYGGQENDGYTIIELKRALITGDSYDASLSSGDVSIIWAYGSSDDISKIHKSRGTGSMKI